MMDDEDGLIERKTNSAKSRSPSIGESLYASTILLFAFLLSQTFSPFGYLEGGHLFLNSFEVRESDICQFSFETKLSF